MPNPVLPKAAEVQLLGNLTAAGALLDGVKVHLYTADVLPSDAITLALLTEPTFTGYAPSTVVAWGAPLNQPGGGVYLEAPAKEFRCTADSAGDVVRGAYYSKDAVVGPPAVPETLIAVVPFEEPVAIAAVNDGLWHTPKFGYPDLSV